MNRVAMTTAKVVAALNGDLELWQVVERSPWRRDWIYHVRHVILRYTKTNQYYRFLEYRKGSLNWADESGPREIHYLVEVVHSSLGWLPAASCVAGLVFGNPDLAAAA